MLKIRLARYGGTNKPAYKIVVAPARSPRSRALAFLGYYDPGHTPSKLQIDKDKYEHFIKEGAQPTDAVVELLKGSYEYVKYEPKTEGEKEDQDEKEEAVEETPEKEEIKAENEDKKRDRRGKDGK